MTVHTQVNEVINGAIKNVTLRAERAERSILSAQMKMNEACTEAHSLKIEVYSKEKNLVREAAEKVICELHDRGIKMIRSEQLEELSKKE